MTTEKALELALPNIIIILGIAIAVTIWLCRALSKPRNRLISILLNGFAFIAFVVGMAITAGPHPRFYASNSKGKGFISSGPGWGLAIGGLLALVLCIIAWRYAKKASRDKSHLQHSTMRRSACKASKRG